MRPRRDGVFDELDPPPGGVERLRERIGRATRARVRRRRAAGALVLAPLLAAVGYLALAPPRSIPPSTFGFSPTRVGLGLDPAPEQPVTIVPEGRGSTAIQQVSLGTDTVLLYLVGSVD